jgi:hypothetical protein
MSVPLQDTEFLCDLIMSSHQEFDGTELIPYRTNSAELDTALPPSELIGVPLFLSYGGRFSMRFALLGPR